MAQKTHNGEHEVEPSDKAVNGHAFVADEGELEAELPSPEDVAAVEADTALVEEPVIEGRGRELSDESLARAVGALLFAANEPLSASRIANLLEGAETARVEAALAALAERLRAANLPYELRAIAGGWQILTAPDQDEVVARLARVRKDDKVSPASLETLAVIAYRQPVTKAEIEAIRGVQVGPILRALVDRGFVRVAGRADVPGHPLLYGTTKKFLDTFGLASLTELPRDAELVRD